MQPIGKYILVIGLIIAVLGAALWLGGNKLGWFGRLPGDIRVEREGFKLYAPFVSMLLLSLAVSVILWLVNRFLR